MFLLVVVLILGIGAVLLLNHGSESPQAAPAPALQEPTCGRNKNVRTRDALMETDRQLYLSANGDKWLLVVDQTGSVFVRHHADLPSGGNIPRIEVGDFLNTAQGRQQQELLRLIGTLTGNRNLRCPR